MPRDYQLPHTLTRWRSDGVTDIYGQTGYSVAVLKCRFTEINKLYVDDEGQERRSEARVYTSGDDLAIGDAIVQGDYSNASEPVSGAYRVKNRRVSTNQRGTRTEYRYIC